MISDYVKLLSSGILISNNTKERLIPHYLDQIAYIKANPSDYRVKISTQSSE